MLEHLEAPRLVLSGLHPFFDRVGGACQTRDRLVAFGVERVLDRFQDGDRAPVLCKEVVFDHVKERGLLAGRNLVDCSDEH